MESTLNKISNSWSKEETLVLIKEYKKHEFLYQVHHPDHLLPYKKRDALAAIVEALKVCKPKVTEKMIRIKLKTLAQQIASERKKMIKCKKSGAVFKPTLWCFDELLFLLQARDDCAGKLNISEIVDSSSDDQIYTPPEVEKKQPVNLHRPISIESNIDRFQKTADKSLQLIEMMSQEKECMSREDAFCQYLSTELKSLKFEESFDELQMAVMVSLQSVKAKERQQLLLQCNAIKTECSSPTTSTSNTFMLHSHD